MKLTKTLAALALTAVLATGFAGCANNNANDYLDYIEKYFPGLPQKPDVKVGLNFYENILILLNSRGIIS